MRPLRTRSADEAGGTRGDTCSRCRPVPTVTSSTRTRASRSTLGRSPGGRGEAPRAHRPNGDDGGRMGRGVPRGSAGGLEAATHRREPSPVAGDPPHRLRAGGVGRGRNECGSVHARRRCRPAGALAAVPAWVRSTARRPAGPRSWPTSSRSRTPADVRPALCFGPVRAGAGVRSLVQGGIELDEARRLAGLGG